MTGSSGKAIPVSALTFPAEEPSVAATPSTTVCASHVTGACPSKRPKNQRMMAEEESAML